MSESGLANWSTAKTSSMEIKIIIGEKINGRTTSKNNNFVFSLNLFF